MLYLAREEHADFLFLHTRCTLPSYSIKHGSYDANNPDAFPETCITSQGPQPVGPDQEETTIVWTYRVHWQQSTIRWASRWDVYLMMSDDQIHWFSIINSLMIVLFLTGMIGMVLMRTLHQDFRRYELGSQEDAQGLCPAAVFHFELPALRLVSLAGLSLLSLLIKVCSLFSTLVSSP
jgi:Endomembrane protein 70